MEMVISRLVGTLFSPGQWDYTGAQADVNAQSIDQVKPGEVKV